MPSKGNKTLDPRIETIFSCAMDYSSWYDEVEEQDAIKEVAQQSSIDTNQVEQIRSWWFQEENPFLVDLRKAIVNYSKAEGLDSEEIETIKAQFDSDIFCGDLIVFLGMHLFGVSPQDDDVQFAETIEVNDVDPEDLNLHFASFLSSSLPEEVTKKFFSSPAGLRILSIV